MYLLKKEEDIEITEKSLFKTKGFALLFPNHVQLVKSKRKGHTCISTPKIGQKTSSLPATRSCLVSGLVEKILKFNMKVFNHFYLEKRRRSLELMNFCWFFVYLFLKNILLRHVV